MLLPTTMSTFCRISVDFTVNKRLKIECINEWFKLLNTTLLWTRNNKTKTRFYCEIGLCRCQSDICFRFRKRMHFHIADCYVRQSEFESVLFIGSSWISFLLLRCGYECMCEYKKHAACIGCFTCMRPWYQNSR